MNAAPAPDLSVIGFDHLVLTCTSVDTTLAWYLERLGMEPVRVDQWRRGEAPFPSARADAGTIIDFIQGEPRPDRLDHVCLVVAPTDLAAVASSGGFDVVDGPCTRYGARGNGTSLYVRDPDGLVVELRHY
jgi:catechol 2,3-dioxygenase-like lactoylglutathione lyase family enzyme